MVERLEEAGYSEVILPVLDYLEPYETLLTDSSRSELYRFVDRDGELLALRADFTPMLARVLAPRLPALPRPLRLYYRGDVVRYHEEQRAGGQREFYQVGAELLGAPGEDAELDVLRLFLDLMTRGEAQPRHVVLGFAGALDHLLLEHAEDVDPARLADAVARRERGIPSRVSPALRQVVEHGMPDDPKALGEAAGERLERLLDVCDRLQEEIAPSSLAISIDLAEFSHQVLDPRLDDPARFRAYYDGLLFRGYAGRRGLAVGAGGRYDRLFSTLGAEVSAAGFSLDLERLMDPSAATEGSAS